MISPDDAMLAKQSLVWIQTYLHQSAIRKPRFISQNYPIIINEFIVLIHSFHCWNYASYFKMSSTFSEVPTRSAAVSCIHTHTPTHTVRTTNSESHTDTDFFHILLEKCPLSKCPMGKCPLGNCRLGNCRAPPC